MKNRRTVYRDGMKLAVLLPDQRIVRLPKEQVLTHAVRRDGDGVLRILDQTPFTGYKIVVL